MINQCKKELDVPNQTTKDIITRLKAIEIDETNFETFDKEAIKDFINSY
jgi:hypothetical protein